MLRLPISILSMSRCVGFPSKWWPQSINHMYMFLKKKLWKAKNICAAGVHNANGFVKCPHPSRACVLFMCMTLVCCATNIVHVSKAEIGIITSKSVSFGFSSTEKRRARIRYFHWWNMRNGIFCSPWYLMRWQPFNRWYFYFFLALMSFTFCAYSLVFLPGNWWTECHFFFDNIRHWFFMRKANM